jgi:AraC-like DNA-binding protein
MLFLNHIPKPSLSKFVDQFWLYEGVPRQTHFHERLMPDGSVELVINLAEDQACIYDRENYSKFERFPGSIVAGPHSNFFVIDTAQQASVLGIHFKPGGAFPFFKLPLDELWNSHVSLADLWGADAGILRECLLAAPTPEAKLLTLEKYLLAHALKPLDRHPAVRFALAQFHGLHPPRTIGEVTNQIGLSSRHFIQLFSGEVGLTPKLFCRVRRFQQVLQLLHTGRDCNWVDIAADCGYFDQAHFIHDFKAFSGINPSTYMVSKTEHQNHVPIQG